MPYPVCGRQYGVVAANLLLLPMSTTASAPDTVSLAGAIPALLALALALGSLVLHLVVLRMRRNCRSHVLLGLERQRASSDAQLQGIQGLLFQLQAVHDLLPGRTAEARSALERAMGAGDGMVAQLLESARASVPAPGPGDLANGLGLMASELAGHRTGGTRLRVLARGRPRPVARTAHEGLLLAARAALSSSLQHSCGHHFELELTYLHRCLTLRVQDDGAGLDKAVGGGQRAGLATICSICSAIGAHVEVWSRARAGTALTITLPWARAGTSGTR